MMHWLLITYPLLLMQAQLGSASCGYNTYLHRRQEGNETTVAVSKFGYGPTNGPTNWHGLSTENKLCATGTNQSPINIDSTVATKVNAADVLNMVILVGQEMELENLGSTVEVVATGNTTINNEAFTLKQFHFHTPSEHRLNNENFPLEMHMVHEATNDSTKIAVVSLLFQGQAANSTAAVDTIAANVNTVATPGSTTALEGLDLTGLTNTLNQASFFTYTGSLTTPPCAEGLQFFVTSDPLPLKVDTINAIKSVVGTNNRPIQNNAGELNILSLSAQSLMAFPEAAANLTQANVAASNSTRTNTTNSAAFSPRPSDAATFSSLQRRRSVNNAVARNMRWSKCW